MSGQAQCPNCGGYKVTAQKFAIKQVTPVSIENRLKLTGALLLAATVAVGVGLLIGEGWSIGCGGFLAFSWVIGALSTLFRSKVSKAVGTGYDLACALCGYRWEWQEGQPWPKVNVNPELIAKGAQKLQEEEEAARRQQEQAAFYYLSQQGKK